MSIDGVALEFIRAVKMGKNCCLTGGGGVGKTYTINKMRDMAKVKKIAMTALTGLASMHVGGSTIHKFSGMGGWNHRGHIRAIKRLDDWCKVVERINSFDIVVIDEISMMRSDQFDLLNLIFKHATGDFESPFGGKQIIAVGDFLQLPPVVKDSDNLAEPWAFQSEAWGEARFQTFHLTEIKRQSDVVFINALNEIRFGKCGFMTQAVLKGRSGGNPNTPVKLVSKNKQADAWNHLMISRLEGKAHFLKAVIEYSPLLESHIADSEGKLREKLVKYRKGLYRDIKQSVNVNDTVWIKDGSRVMVMANNDDAGYVNGMTGELVSLSYMINTTTRKYQEADFLLEHREVPFEYFKEKKIVGNENREEIEVDTSTIKIPWWKEVSEEIRNWLNVQVQWGDFKPTLVAQIRLDDGQYVYVEKKTYEIKDNKFSDEYMSMITYTQFPIRPAYAISIHKSQGMTLDVLEVECEGMFAEGQMYVALSRASTIEGLSLRNFNPHLVKANTDAVEFYNKLNKGEESDNA